jgi:LPXTG-motif cell wall-anchored protein
VELPFTLKDRPPVPETGDGANLILWSALVAVSVIAMAMMLCKRKEA